MGLGKLIRENKFGFWLGGIISIIIPLYWGLTHFDANIPSWMVIFRIGYYIIDPIIHSLFKSINLDIYSSLLYIVSMIFNFILYGFVGIFIERIIRGKI